MHFDLGMIVATQRADSLLPVGVMQSMLARHANRDWGDISQEDKELNEAAIQDGSRIMSVYEYEMQSIWLITDAVGESGKREVTTFLLPEEY